jgi:small subunit ribosomal protein S9
VSDEEPTAAQPPEPSAAEPTQPAAAEPTAAAAADPAEAGVAEPTAAADVPATSEPAPAAEPAAAEPATSEPAPAAEPAAAAEPATSAEPTAETPAAPPAADAPARRRSADDDDAAPATARVKPSVPGADLEVDIVPEGVDPLARQSADPYALEDDEPTPVAEESTDDETVHQPIEQVAIDLAAGARYRATGKRKTAIARVTIRPGTGAYTVNGKTLNEYFPRPTLQRNIRQPLETVGYQDRMDVIARLHGGGVSAQGGALRHGISRALLEADPNLRGELKRRGFLTRDARAKERKKAGLKKARKRPQFSKR